METRSAGTWQVGGLNLHLAEAGAGPPLLLVHGFPFDHTMWTGQLAALARHARVLAPDLRGFGRSDGAGETVEMAQYADDLAGLLDARGIRQGVVFCGLSMGGYIAWQFFRRHRPRLRGLILCDTRAAADTELMARARRTNAQRVMAEGLGFLAAGMLDKLFAPQTQTEQPELVEATRRVMLATSPSGAAAALRGMAARPDVSAWLPEIDVPTLVLCGCEDAITSVAEMQDMAARLPQARFVEIAAAGHLAPLEQPQAVNEAMAEFLREC